MQLSPVPLPTFPLLATSSSALYSPIPHRRSHSSDRDIPRLRRRGVRFMRPGHRPRRWLYYTRLKSSAVAVPVIIIGHRFRGVSGFFRSIIIGTFTVPAGPGYQAHNQARRVQFADTIGPTPGIIGPISLFPPTTVSSEVGRLQDSSPVGYTGIAGAGRGKKEHGGIITTHIELA